MNKKFEIDHEAALELGNLLKQRREELEYSMDALSALTDVDKAEISRIEKGNRKKINPFFLNEICNALHLDLVSVYKIIGYLGEGAEHDWITPLLKGIDSETKLEIIKVILKELSFKAVKTGDERTIEKVKYVEELLSGEVLDDL